MKTSNTSTELKLAEEIVSVLPAGSWSRLSSTDRGLIVYGVRADGLKVKAVVFSRASLTRLASDPARDIKVEYLQRDLARNAKRRAEFRYPHLMHPTKAPRRRAVAALRSMAATIPIFG